MKPTSRQILTLLSRHQGLWVSHADLAIVGGHRFGGRLMELRQAGYQIEQRGVGEKSSYRLVGMPPSPYQNYSCDCGWTGDDIQANHGWTGALCPRCGQGMGERQMVLAL